MSSNSPVIILGGGMAGLAAAYELHRQGLPFHLYEAAPRFGGLCQTITSGDFRFDLGAHRLHDQDPEVTAAIRALLGDKLHEIDIPSQILWQGNRLRFPLSPFNIIRSCSLRQSARFALDFIRQRLKTPSSMDTFADLSIHRFGASMARNFLMDYSEKLWGYPSHELSPEVATKRLQGLSLKTILMEMLGRKAQHIDGRFLYPEGGFGTIADAMASKLPSDSLFSNHRVTDIQVIGNRIRSIIFENGHTLQTPETVISTLPLTTHASLIRHPIVEKIKTASQRIRFRSVRLFFVRVAKPRITTDASLYFSDPRTPVTRLHEPKNRSSTMAPDNTTSAVIEVPCFSGDDLHGESGSRLFAESMKIIGSYGLFKESEVLGWEEKTINHAYPVYSLGYEKDVSVILEALGTFNGFHPMGRNGLFHYSHLHDQWRMARELIQTLKQNSYRPQAA